MKKDKFLEKIFSIKNSKFECGKTVTVFGFEFKFDISFFYKYIIKNTPVVENKILFTNFTNNSYGCNPKYIAQEIINQKLPYELVWIVKNPKKERKYFPKEIKLVKDTTLNSIKEHASAKIWISNQRKMNLLHKGLYKKDNQIYIQTWHGMPGLKKIEAQITNIDERYKYWANRDSKQTDYIITNSDFETGVFKKDFWYKNKIVQIGHAREDVFYFNKNLSESIKDKVYKYLKIPKEKSIVLYAPTFRDSKKIDVYDLDKNMLLNSLKEKFDRDFVILTRLHPNLLKKFSKIYNNSIDIIDCSFYQDIQEIMLCVDVLISDYSSCLWDFMLTRRPAFIYATDIENYKTERGFLFNLDEIPFEVASSNSKLIENISKFSQDDYNKKCTSFMNLIGRNQCLNSSSRIVDLIRGLIGEEK